MFNLLGLTIERKRQKLLNNYNEKLNKQINRYTQKDKTQMKQQRDQEMQAEFQRLEKLSGDFEKIYPLDTIGIPANLSAKERGKLQQNNQYFCRQNEMYTEILGLSTNTEKLTSIRMLKKIEEEKAIEKERKK